MHSEEGAWDSLCSFEKDSVKKGLRDGQAERQRRDRLEGRLLGAKKGAEFGKEIGFYLGFADAHLKARKINGGGSGGGDGAGRDKATRALESLLKLVRDFPEHNDCEDASAVEKLNSARAKYKQCRSILGLNSATGTTKDMSW